MREHDKLTLTQIPIGSISKEPMLAELTAKPKSVILAVQALTSGHVACEAK